MSSTLAEPGLEAPALPRGRVRTHLAVPLYRNAYALVLNTGITSLLGIGYWALAARRYPPAEVGRASAAISAMILLSGFAQLNLQSSFPRLIPVAGRGIRQLVIKGYVVAGTVSVAAATAFVVGVRWLGGGAGFLEGSWLVSGWFVAAVLTWTVFTLQDSVMAGLREAVWVPVENASFSIGKVGLLLVFAGSSQRFGLFASWTAPVAVALVPVNWLIFARLIPRHASPTASPGFSRRQLVSYVAGEYVGGLFSTGALTMLPLLVSGRLGLTANGYFYTAWVVGTSFDQILSQIGISLTVEGSRDEASVATAVRKTIRFGLILIVPGVVTCFIAAPTVLGFLGHSYSTHGVTVLRVIILAVIPRAVTLLYLSMARIERRAGRIAVVQATLCLLVVGGGWVGLGRFGLDGAGYGYAVAQLIVGLCVLPAVVRRLRLPA